MLNLSEKSKAEELIKRHIGSELTKISVITCISVLNRNSPEQNAVACPVVGTEAGHIYVLDPQAFTIIHQVKQNKKKETSKNYFFYYRLAFAAQKQPLL